jgi:hypothetical protein
VRTECAGCKDKKDKEQDPDERRGDDAELTKHDRQWHD